MKKTKLLLCLAAISLVLAGCGKKKGGEGGDEGGGEVTPTYTYKTYTAVSPSDWNELSLGDANDRQIQSYIASSLFTFNYKFEEGHYGERDHIVQGDFAVEYDGATKLEDVTTAYAGDEKYNVPADATEGYAYKITLRDDLKWDDGTPIKADDFVYSMQQQLSSKYIFRNADVYYKNSLQIANAQKYFKGGQSGHFDATTIHDAYSTDLDEELVFTFEGYDGGKTSFYGIVQGFKEEYNIPGDTFYELVGNTFGPFALTEEELASLEGKTLAAIKADATLKALLDKVIEWWDEGEEAVIIFTVAPFTYPAYDWDKVGIMKGANDLEIIVVLDKTLMLLEDGEICFKTAYNFNSLPLVKRALFEANAHEPALGSKIWTSTYCSDVASTASWGPYKLTNFQAGKHYELEKNPNWYGWNMDEYKGQYQAEKIVCETIAEFETAWQLFQKGDLSDIGLNVTIAQEYNKSSRAFFSGDDYIYTLQVQSMPDALKTREAEAENVDKEMLIYPEFRKAMSLAIDRAAYASATTTASQAGFGLLNMYHYYDIEHGKAYRNEDVAKKVLCEVYGVDVSEYENLDAAYAAVDGYDLTLAKQLVRTAYDKAIAADTIDADDNVVLTFGSSADNANVRRYVNNLEAFLKEMVKETPLENRLSLEFKDFGDNWSKSFRAGAYDLTLSGWSGGAWDPGYFIGAYLDSDRYAQGWDPATVDLTYNPWGDEEGEHRELTMDLMEWYDCLNGNGGAYDWSEGKIENSFRLGIIAQLEKAVLETYLAIPLMYWYGATILSYQVDYGSRVDNPVLGFGGFRWMVFNYSDQEWESRKTSYDYRK